MFYHGPGLKMANPNNGDSSIRIQPRVLAPWDNNAPDAVAQQPTALYVISPLMRTWSILEEPHTPTGASPPGQPIWPQGHPIAPCGMPPVTHYPRRRPTAWLGWARLALDWAKAWLAWLAWLAGLAGLPAGLGWAWLPGPALKGVWSRKRATANVLGAQLPGRVPQIRSYLQAPVAPVVGPFQQPALGPFYFRAAGCWRFHEIGPW